MLDFSLGHIFYPFGILIRVQRYIKVQNLHEHLSTRLELIKAICIGLTLLVASVQVTNKLQR